MAKIIEKIQRPTPPYPPTTRPSPPNSPPSSKEFFPNNAVEYFVSYYDYYQPEAYIPHTDTYIAKDSDVNEELDKLRLSRHPFPPDPTRFVIEPPSPASTAWATPPDYYSFVAEVKKGEWRNRSRLVRNSSNMQYERNDMDLARGRFRIRGDTLEMVPAYEELALRIQFWGDEVERIVEVDPSPVRCSQSVIPWSSTPPATSSPPRKKCSLPLEDIEVELGRTAGLNSRPITSCLEAAPP